VLNVLEATLRRRALMENTDFQRVSVQEIPAAPGDQDLIAAINRGDSAAFELLYFRYRDWVAALAFRFTGDHALSLDVLQETFLYLLKKFPGFTLTANLKTFLYPAIRHLAIAAREKARRCQGTEPEWGVLEELPATDVGAPPRETLGPLLASLPAEHRELLLLRFVDGLSLAEIASALNLPLGTVKSRLHNVLIGLRGNEATKRFF